MGDIAIGGVPYRRIFCASGAANIDGGGYPYHKHWWWRGVRGWYNDDRVTKQMKTITDGSKGNMPLRADGVTPIEFLPRCIVADPITAHAQNAVGLSCWSYEKYFDGGIWRGEENNFWISYLANADTPEGRIAQTEKFASACQQYFPTLRIKPGVMLNGGCPNVKHRSTFTQEIIEEARILRRIGGPIGFNCSPVTELEFVLTLAGYFDLVAPCNAIPHAFMAENDEVWLSYWWSKESILKKRGFTEGGWSGNRCRKYALRIVRQIREADKKVILMGGNGILAPWDIDRFRNAGADLVSIGILPTLYPFRWWLNQVISRADKIEWEVR
ncbi:MAG: hypothetical protein NTZ65_03425 [Candidatus Berkelbacteria bacterium]|nr:hypothetical protein [Candidatus Berkelbacteria bacterium]